MNNYIKNIVEAFDFNNVRNNITKNNDMASRIKDVFIMKPLVNKIKNGERPDDATWNKYKNTPVYKVQSKKELRLLIENTMKIFDNNCSLNWIDTSNITDMSELCKDFGEIVGYLDMSKWDVSNVKDMSRMFSNCFFLELNLSNWDVSNVRSMMYMFENCGDFNSDLSRWDVSNVENMKGMFYCCHNFSSDLSKWNVSNVRSMRNMFSTCLKFNSDLSKWNVSNVTDMYNMFSICMNFNSDLSKWNVSNVTDMRYMFDRCWKFNSDLSKWDVSNVGDNMEGMFLDCKSLKMIPSWLIAKAIAKAIENGIQLNKQVWNKYKNTPIYKVKSKKELIMLIKNTIKIFGDDCSLNWIDTSNITDMSGLFEDFSSMVGNIDISKWNVSNVTDMSYMFEQCISFNCDLSKWDVSNVKNMEGMFLYSTGFDCDLSNWDVSNVENMNKMFLGTWSFTCDISKWDVSKVKDMREMFDESALKQIPSWYKGIKKDYEYDEDELNYIIKT